MALRFDATLKELVQGNPSGFLADFGWSQPMPAAVLPTDLSALTAHADIVIGIGEPRVSVIDVEFQSGPDEDLEARLLMYNAILFHRYRVPVHTLVFLLHPRADRPSLDGRLSYQAQPGRGGVDFTFEVVRLWEKPVEQLLTGSLFTVPLAALGRLPEGMPKEQALAEVARRMVERLLQVADPVEMRKLMMAALILLGLRVSRDEILQLFPRDEIMVDLTQSSTYQYILEEGLAQGEIKDRQSAIVELLGLRFPDSVPAELITTIHNQNDLNTLKHWFEQAATCASLAEFQAKLTA
jgi:predicted transposase YdaD